MSLYKLEVCYRKDDLSELYEYFLPPPRCMSRLMNVHYDKCGMGCVGLYRIGTCNPAISDQWCNSCIYHFGEWTFRSRVIHFIALVHSGVVVCVG